MTKALIWQDQGNKARTDMRNQRRIGELLRDSRAATAIEYALIAALIAVACVGAFQVMGDQIESTWGNITDITANQL